MRPLDGVRILDLSRLLPGPFATMVLADLGATVDRVDAPAAEVIFPPLNRGKRSITLDLKASGAAAMFTRLAGAYDVVFESFRPGVMDRLGIGHGALCAAHPRLIVCALTGYGQSGSHSKKAGHDLNYVARAGLLGLMGPPDEAPQVPGFQVADIGGGLFAVIALLAALRERDKTGQGTVLDVALCEAAIPFATAALAELLAGGYAARGAGTLTGGIAAYNTYGTSDGGYVALAALEPKFLQRFCEGAGIAFDPAALVPGPHQTALKQAFGQVFAAKTRAEWEQFGEQHDCCLESVLEPAELRDDAEPSAGALLDGSAARASPCLRTPLTPLTPKDVELGAIPNLGPYADMILRDAGFSEAEIARVRADGILR